MTFLSLFSGIGGLDLGLERAGMRCVGQVEVDPFCRRVLAKHWPDVPRFEDVRTFDPSCINEQIDVVAGGFPCQPTARCGYQRRQEDHRWLWPQFARIVREVRPDYVIVENPTGLFDGGIGDVLGDLAALGFDAEWDCLPARTVGAAHSRDRLWLVGYSDCVGQPGQVYPSKLPQAHEADADDSAVGSVCFAWPPGPGSVDSIPRMADGLSRQLVRTRRKQSHTALGNAVVPQVAELIGRAILAMPLRRQRDAKGANA